MKWFEKIKNTLEISSQKEKIVSAEPKEQKQEKKNKEKEVLLKGKEESFESAVKKENIGKYSHILLRPTISEKSTRLNAMGQYIFEVSPRSNKIEIKKAIEDVYGVKPAFVAVSVREGKKVRYGKKFGKRHDKKMAIVTLKKGDSLHLYEGV